MTNRAGRRRRHKRHKARTRIRRIVNIEFVELTKPWRSAAEVADELRKLFFGDVTP